MSKSIFLLLLLAVPSYADLSDSGNLIIGGQAVVSGTMTVSGSSFSVGGYGFSISGGSATVTGQLKLPAAGVQWADGSTSTTANSGAAVLGATQTFNGANTFAGSLILPPGSAATINGSINAEVMVASQDVVSAGSSQVSTITFSLTPYLFPWEVDASSIDWRLKFKCAMSSNVYIAIVFNNDTGPHYSFGASAI